MDSQSVPKQFSENSAPLMGEDLLDNPAFIQQMLSVVPSIVYVRDLQEVRNIFINRSVSDELGYSPEEVIVMGADFPKRVMHPQDYARLPDLEGKFQTLEDGEVILFEYRMKHRDGQWRWYLSRDCIFTRAADGTPLQIIGTATDITQRKKLEEQVLAQYEELENIYSTIPVGLALIDKAFCFVRVNKRLAETNGISVEEHLGKKIDQVLPALAEAAKKILNQVFDTGEPVLDVEISGETQAKPGVLRYWNESWYPVKDPAGNTIAISVVVEEITKRKQAEDKLRENEKRFRLAVKNSKIVLAEVNPDLRYKWAANPHPDFDETMLIGKRDDELLPMEQAKPLIAVKEQVLQSGVGCRTEIVVPLSDALHVYDFQVEPVFDDFGNVSSITTAAMDITARKAAEEKLVESEVRFRNMADHAPVMIWVTESDGNCTYLSQSWYEFTGQTPESGLGIGWLKAVHPEDQALSETTFLLANQKQEAFRLEYRLRRHDGVYRWAIDSAKPRFSTQGEFLGYIGSVIDITERKYHELNAQFLSETTQDLARLSKSDEIMQVLGEKIANHLQVSRVFFVEVNDFQNISIVLHDWCEEDMPSTIGIYPLEDYASSAFLQELKLGNPVVIHDFKTNPITAANAERFEALKMGAALNAPHLSNGELKFLLAVQHAHPYHWREDEVSLMQELSARIWTQIERTRTQEALSESENRLRLAQQAAGIGIYDYDIRSGAIQWDARVRELWGVQPDEAITYEVFSAGLHPDDREDMQAAVDQALDPTGNGQYHAEYRVINKKDHIARWISAIGQVAFEEDRAVRLVGTVQDITERKELETMKDTLVRIAGHELRTPLTSILGNMSLAKRMLPPDSPGSSQIQRAMESSLKMRDMIQDFLDSYRLQHLEMTYEMTVFDFDALVQKVVENTQAIHPKYQILLQGQTGVSLTGDPGRMEQVINNLLSNAIKYSPGKNLVEVSLHCTQMHVQLLVKDYGIGIASEEILKIFNRFHRADNIGKIKGMGLGLYLVKQIVEHHKGTIQVSSQLGEGSSFLVELPIL